MMGRQSEQLSMMILDPLDLFPNNHSLRKLPQIISGDIIYQNLGSCCVSTDPVMLLEECIRGIISERRLVQEIQLNLAYRWFCGVELADRIPHHSTLSKTRVRKWNESKLFHQVFLEIIRRCVKGGRVDGKELAVDGTYLSANVSKESWIETKVETELSMQSYLDCLDEELSNSLDSKSRRP